MTPVTGSQNGLDAEVSGVLDEHMGRVVGSHSGDRPRVSAVTRTQTMDLLTAPRGPIDRSAYEWTERIPGIKFHLTEEDEARGVKKFLVWAQPGAKTPRHGHTDDEVILVLEGALRDYKGTFGPGQICRTRKGEFHFEEVPQDVECVCFVVYYGDLILADDATGAA